MLEHVYWLANQKQNVMIDRAKCFPQPHFTHTYDIPHRGYLKHIYKHSCYHHPTDADVKHPGAALNSEKVQLKTLR